MGRLYACAAVAVSACAQLLSAEAPKCYYYFDAGRRITRLGYVEHENILVAVPSGYRFRFHPGTHRRVADRELSTFAWRVSKVQVYQRKDGSVILGTREDSGDGSVTVLCLQEDMTWKPRSFEEADFIKEGRVSEDQRTRLMGLCPRCSGSRKIAALCDNKDCFEGKITRTCDKCRGEGIVIRERVDIIRGRRYQKETTCPRCKGRGVVVTTCECAKEDPPGITFTTCSNCTGRKWQAGFSDRYRAAKDFASRRLTVRAAPLSERQRYAKLKDETSDRIKELRSEIFRLKRRLDEDEKELYEERLSGLITHLQEECRKPLLRIDKGVRYKKISVYEGIADMGRLLSDLEQHVAQAFAGITNRLERKDEWLEEDYRERVEVLKERVRQVLEFRDALRDRFIAVTAWTKQKGGRRIGDSQDARLTAFSEKVSKLTGGLDADRAFAALERTQKTLQSVPDERSARAELRCDRWEEQAGEVQALIEAHFEPRVTYLEKEKEKLATARAAEPRRRPVTGDARDEKKEKGGSSNVIIRVILFGGLAVVGVFLLLHVFRKLKTPA